MKRTKGNLHEIKERPVLNSDMQNTKTVGENGASNKKLTMRERLEKWREEKGMNKPDKAHPLLSRKRPLVSCDSKQNVIKKMKITVSKENESAKDIKKKPKGINEVGKKFSHSRNKAAGQTNPGEALSNDKVKVLDGESFGSDAESKNMNDSRDEIIIPVPESGCNVVEEKESPTDNEEGRTRKDKSCASSLAAIEEEHEGVTPEHEEENEAVFVREPGKCLSPTAKVPTQSDIKDFSSKSERFATFSFCETQKQKSTSSKRDIRRKTMCLTQLHPSKPDGHYRMKPGNHSHRPYSAAITANKSIRPSSQKTPVRVNASRMLPNSAPSRRSEMSFMKQRLAKDQQQTAMTAMHTTPLKRLVDSLPANSALKAPPCRPVSSARKPNKSNVSTAEKSKQIKPRLAPPNNMFSKLPSNSLLRSAPLRRSRSYRQSMSAAAANIAPATPSSNIKRRKTIQFASERLDSTPICQPPFTPRGDWQNKELSIRNTVKKPFIVIKQTPGKKRRPATPPNEDEIGLNTTFTFESESEEDADNEIKQIEKKIPPMNELEKAVVEESLQQMVERLGKPSEVEAVHEELDLILSTSPGVVRLASFWIVRSRLAAIKDDVDRVICLLEQANAFDAQPHSIIRDEICKYLEQLKREQCEQETGIVARSSSDSFDNAGMDVELKKAPKTPGKRVTFAESQQHVIFKSSLIRFCLLECTPFRKRLKSTLGRQVLTPVRRSGRIEKFESRLPSVVQSHVLTASSPRQFAKNIEDGDVYYLPNPNVTSKWNDIWAHSDGEENKHDLSF